MGTSFSWGAFFFHIMDIKEIRQFIDEEFKKLIKPCGDNHHKLMEKVLQARFRIFDFISKGVPHEVKTGINLGEGG